MVESNSPDSVESDSTETTPSSSTNSPTETLPTQFSASHFFTDLQQSAPIKYVGSLITEERVAGIRGIFTDRDDDEIEEIEHFKYKQELERKLTVTSVIGLGFTVMGVPFGLSSTLWISLMDGANVTILYGWIIVCIMSLFVVLSLSEIISKYPTAGGVYHFSALLSPEKYSLISSWITGWLLLIGNWTYAVSIMFSGSQFILSIFGLKDFEYKEDRFFVLGVYFLILLFVGLINVKFSKHLEKINKMCILWTIYTVLAIDVLLIFFAKKTNSVKTILTKFDNSRSGWPDPIAFIVGLQSSSFTLTGYGMLFSITDEVKNPEKNMPKGVISSILMASIVGIIFIVPILTILPELELLLDQNSNIMPIDLIFKLSTESYLISFLMAVLMIGTVIFQSIGSLTTASRSTYALARDGGLPMAYLWTEINSTEDYKIPRNAIFLSMFVCAVLSFLSLISKAAFNAFMGAAVVSLAVANGIPIFLLMLNKRQKIRGSAFRLRKLGWFVNGVAVFWILLSIFILCMPPVIRNLTWWKMNYASVVLIVFLLIAGLSYISWGDKIFTGPQIDTDYFELNNLEAAGRKNLDNFVIDDDDDDDDDDEEDEEEEEDGKTKSNETEIDDRIVLSPPKAIKKKGYEPIIESSSNSMSNSVQGRRVIEDLKQSSPNSANDKTSDGDDEISTESETEILFNADEVEKG
ncbi:TPO5 [Candida pseudojiufengensis]|uniref:TPO5 n=1 Tax=Candida pseudojiufengensis TaxID=497109 RepID=UPI002225943C|nr:TPO5 [Candida pseudojiufengensis]KAI5966219.1 TPO5 [Candida pseudojiufengensis]